MNSSTRTADWREHAAYFGAWAAGGLAVAVLVLMLRHGWPGASGHEGGNPRSYASAVGAAGPSVVNIANRIVTEQSYSRLEGNPAAQRFLGPSFSPVGPPAPAPGGEPGLSGDREG